MSSSKGSVILTGANGGLGCGIVSKLFSKPELHGIFTVRDSSSAAHLKAVLQRAPVGYTYDIFSLDLSILNSVRETAHNINARIKSGEIPPIRVLILNAAYLTMKDDTFTKDGYEMSFQSNYLSQWLFTLMLLGSMDHQHSHSRIVMIGSDSHDVTAPLQQLSGHYKEEKWQQFFSHNTIDGIATGSWSSSKDDDPMKAGIRRYGASKMCLIMMVGELQHRLDTDPVLNRVCTVGVDPGTMRTALNRRGIVINRYIWGPLIVPLLAWILSFFTSNPLFRTVEKSSGDVLAAAFEAGGRLKGRYLNGAQLQDVAPEANDIKKRRMVWRDSVKYTKLNERDTELTQWK